MMPNQDQTDNGKQIPTFTAGFTAAKNHSNTLTKMRIIKHFSYFYIVNYNGYTCARPRPGLVDPRPHP